MKNEFVSAVIAAAVSAALAAPASGESGKITNKNWFGIKDAVESEGFRFTGAPRTNYGAGTIFIVEYNAEDKKKYRRIVCDRFYEDTELSSGSIYFPTMSLGKNVDAHAGLNFLEGVLPKAAQVGAQFSRSGFKQAEIDLVGVKDYSLPTSLAAKAEQDSGKKGVTEIHKISAGCRNELENLVDSNGRPHRGKDLYVVTRALGAKHVWYDFIRDKETGGGLNLNFLKGLIGLRGGGSGHVTADGELYVDMPDGQYVTVGQNWQEITRINMSTDVSGVNSFTLVANEDTEGNPFSDDVEEFVSE